VSPAVSVECILEELELRVRRLEKLQVVNSVITYFGIVSAVLLSMFYCGSCSTMGMLTGADVHAQNCHFTCSGYIQPFFLGYS
jgi:hypothetical protein